MEIEKQVRKKVKKIMNKIKNEIKGICNWTLEAFICAMSYSYCIDR